tara:strand:- start:2537 stop:3496 length:960 start_codon:yes stop_codon:yes gene_type:complete
MDTKRDKVNKRIEDILNRHTDNVEAIFGIGSFFYSNLDSKSESNDRMMDLILFINNLDKFYNEHEFENDENNTPEVRSKLNRINREVVLNIYHLESKYRLTIIPTEKFVEWTSSRAPIGYFLRGRLQKPLEELKVRNGKGEIIKNQFQKIREEAVDHAFRSVSDPITKEDIYKTIAGLSYIPEGIRGILEGRIMKKHLKIYHHQRERFEGVYGDIIDNYVGKHQITYDHKKGLYFPRTTKEESRKFVRELKKLSPYYARVLQKHAEAHPNPEENAIRKTLRIIHKENNKVLYGVLKKAHFYGGLRKIMQGMAKRTPSRL